MAQLLHRRRQGALNEQEQNSCFLAPAQSCLAIGFGDGIIRNLSSLPIGGVRSNIFQSGALRLDFNKIQLTPMTEPCGNPWVRLLQDISFDTRGEEAAEPLPPYYATACTGTEPRNEFMHFIVV